jgi:hypothetical protein
LALLHDALEEAPEDIHAIAVADASQAGMVRQRFVEVVAELPSDTQPVGSQGKQLALGTEALKEQHQVQLEEDHWVNRGTTNRRIAVGNEIAHEVEVERAVEKPVEVVGRHEVVQREVIDGREATLFDSQHHALSQLVWKDAIVLPRSHPPATGWEVIATAIGLGLARFILSVEPLRVGVVERFAMSCWWIAGESAEPLDIRG